MRALPTALIAIATAAGGFFAGQLTSPDRSEPSQGEGSSLPPRSVIDSGISGGSTGHAIGELSEEQSEAVVKIRSLLSQKKSQRRDLQVSLAILSLDAASLPGAWEELKSLSQFTDYKEQKLVEALLARWGGRSIHKRLSAQLTS